jgi:hypothetical protein
MGDYGIDAPVEGVWLRGGKRERGSWRVEKQAEVRKDGASHIQPPKMAVDLPSNYLLFKIVI